ncbi:MULTISPECIES: bifunctional phosphoribosylaminoimidazolecarboxamide formyltransferase/IMP cyclohydrolase [Gluconobacter]|uniref:Bifunctional purine biosynthesis protein PurH n=1 Tax=Gluconobacter cerinus TaxID=38307 RepID=A0A1B6VHW1_9PROT|nr:MULTISPECIES: bifunctional phosphoribosylaminoimidazolecarboxamide formyltransferase/IMP cyclohydrolase [Gluconobacter]MBM3096946.1 bifunctional phosphoribosylaminoimidazolecarboxamide formyltransferase/IMP cyclohydrolase [Gluconobacter cerinus]MBS0982114.1 bifunctional phosphoribosylaminoimidazolecarboxamide formyltransferase/IMP cyclohydrolase [Gluconobacter cerinus]MBS1024683.1 bifunctional phosphoribosylaminoimidazolecarboxamide formyltransferase/IMP cyclohydrolase [Gluconobacter cerinus]
MTETRLPVRRALLSVSDKTGLIELGRALAAHGAELLSTGGSARALREAGLTVKDVSEHTGFPEILDGRVKTLVPQVHGGILARRDLPAHLSQMEEHGIVPIDLVCVNLYPFAATVASGAGDEDCIENIDIGGPAMIRAAAKNFDHVTILTSPQQYGDFVQSLDAGGTYLSERRDYAGAAYAHTASYDGMISRWFAERAGELLPPVLTLSGSRDELLRYGENPHQKAAFYRDGSTRAGIATARQVQGKALSYNNLNDTDAAFEAVAEFDAPTVVIVKHANPCGVASAETLEQAWIAALRCDPVSAFGGIVAVNRTLDAETAQRISAIFTEVIVAPDADAQAIEILSRKKNLRLLLTGGMPDPEAEGLAFRSVAGGFLAQSRDAGRVLESDLKVVTKRAPTEKEMKDLLFAFRVAKHVKSNAVIYVRNNATVGIGAGQMSRVDSARIAARKSEDAANVAGETAPLTKGSVAASDAFFPFADGLESVVAAGAVAVIQPGGSIRDQEVIDAADAAGIAMVFTGMRHFRH